MKIRPGIYSLYLRANGWGKLWLVESVAISGNASLCYDRLMEKIKLSIPLNTGLREQWLSQMVKAPLDIIIRRKSTRLPHWCSLRWQHLRDPIMQDPMKHTYSGCRHHPYWNCSRARYPNMSLGLPQRSWISNSHHPLML